MPRQISIEDKDYITMDSYDKFQSFTNFNKTSKDKKSISDYFAPNNNFNEQYNSFKSLDSNHMKERDMEEFEYYKENEYPTYLETKEQVIREAASSLVALERATNERGFFSWLKGVFTGENKAINNLKKQYADTLKECGVEETDINNMKTDCSKWKPTENFTVVNYDKETDEITEEEPETVTKETMELRNDLSKKTTEVSTSQTEKIQKLDNLETNLEGPQQDLNESFL